MCDQNPTNTILSQASAEEIVNTCRRERILILCDDVYNLLHFGNGPKPGRLFELNKGRSTDIVVSNGSFSKILSPGLRLGWMELPHWLRRKVLNSQLLGPEGLGDPLTKALVKEALKRGLVQEYLGKLLISYQAKLDVIWEQLSNCKALDLAETNKPSGGFYIWLRLPPHIAAMKVAADLKEKHSVFVIPGPVLSAHPCGRESGQPNALRLAFPLMPVEEAKKAAGILVAALEEYMQ